MANILGIGQSALAAAQIGLATTGHNIANAATPGYSRQEVVQNSLGGQNMGGGFVGKGTEVIAVNRVYNQFLQNQVLSARTANGQVSSYYTQIRQIDNLLSDPTVGVSPALQDFFKGVQTLAADPNSAAARQSMLSAAESLTARFQTVDSQLAEMREGVNAQLLTSMDSVNSYARQIADLNKQIEQAIRNNNGQQPNDLLDQRDQAVAELSKQVKVTTVQQGSSYDIYIGNGQPMVVNARTYNLVPMSSPTDSSRIEIGYQNQNGITLMAESAFTGGTLGGLFEFRAKTLDLAQNSIGRMATVLATAFNAQHQLGQDQTGAMGTAFFRVADPLVTSSSANIGTGTATGAITDASQLTTSDYRVVVTQSAVAPVPPATTGTPAQVQVTRLSDGQQFNSTSFDGVSLTLAGNLQPGDEFSVRPTLNGANGDLGIKVALTDKTQIAVSAPIRTAASNANAGTGKISLGTVDRVLPVNPDLRTPVTITFTSPTTYTVSGTAAGLPPAGTSFNYTAGADISYNGWTMQIIGAPQSGDSFSVGANTNGVGDGRNGVLLGSLQTQNLVNGRSSMQGAYSEMVNMVGNKTRELEVNSTAASKLLELATQSRDAESGVNLDEEAANLMRYQQAYQAAGKVMKTASDLFEMLLSLG